MSDKQIHELEKEPLVIQNDKETFYVQNSKSKNYTSLWRVIAIVCIIGCIILFVLMIIFLILWMICYSKETCLFDNKRKLEALSDPVFHRDLHIEVRENVIDDFIHKYGNHALLYLEGYKEDTVILGSTTNNIQNKNFLYLSGVFWSDYRMLIDLKHRKTILFAHELTPKECVYSYRNFLSLKEIKDKFGVDEVFYNNVENVTTYIKGIHPQPWEIYVENGVKLDFNISIDVNDTLLQNYLYNKRLVKTEKEIELVEFAIMSSANAHMLNMKQVKYAEFEYQISASFIESTIACGCFDLAFPSIVGSGKDGSVLHFESNQNKIDHSKDLLLVDAGAAFYSYCSDITRTYPTMYQGKFLLKHKIVYNMVLNIQMKCIEAVKPGIDYFVVINDIAYRSLLEEMKSNGFLKGNTSEMFEKEVHKIFMPHSVGHHMGLNVHDPVDSQCLPRILEENMIVTIEPGIYFIEYLINQITKEQMVFINYEKVLEYIFVGGIRIEDDILVTQNGYRDLTIHVPKTISSIEAITTQN